MKSKYIFLALLFFTIQPLLESVVAQTKSVKGTWINLPYQDERNKYMNPAHVDCTNPEFWEKKLKEYSRIGIEYLVLMAVANEQKAYYPSTFMPPAYPSERESPVEAIMRTADECNMKVFMSCGWAVSQDDDIRKPEIKDAQLKIMQETAALFSNHKSFFGWYLPVEDSLEPVLSDQAIEAVNILTEKARFLTPNAQIMISPYGLCFSDIENVKFGEQIKKLKVDIVAYQDEVGCVREPMPMKRMKEHFKILRQIHDQTNIQFWANIESFTWEKEAVNSRYSALVPAAFSRYLSQIVGVTKSGVSQILSFSIYGMYDMPRSNMPIGQPEYANKAYQDYADWQSGKGRWAMLEEMFWRNVNHSANGAKVKYISPTNNVFNKGNLTDLALGTENFNDEQWLGFDDGKMEIIIDLGKTKEIQTLVGRFLHYRLANISLPSAVNFYVSNDGKSFEKLRTVVMDISSNDLHDCWIDIAHLDNIQKSGRYIKMVTESESNNIILCDEVLVNPKFDKTKN